MKIKITNSREFGPFARGRGAPCRRHPAPGPMPHGEVGGDRTRVGDNGKDVCMGLLRSEQGGLLSKVLFLLLLLLALAAAIYLWDVGGVLRWLGVKSEQAGKAVKKQSEELGEKADRLKEKTEEKVDKTRKQVDRLKEKL